MWCRGDWGNKDCRILTDDRLMTVDNDEFISRHRRHVMSKILRLFLPIALVGVFAVLVHFAPGSRDGIVTSAAFPTLSAAPEAEMSVRILLGLTDTTSTKWDGSLSVTVGQVARVEPWRFDDDDKLEENSGAPSTARWKMSTHDARAFRPGAAAAAAPGAQPSIVANGVVVTLRDITSG